MNPSQFDFRAQSLSIIENWERLAAQLIVSPVPEARTMGFDLRSTAEAERRKLDGRNSLAERHWWDYRRARAGIR